MSDLGPGDVPAVLQVGEEVLPREEAGLYRQLFPNGMLAALQGAGRASMAGLDSLSGNYLRDYGDVLSGRSRGWGALATLGTPMLGAGVGNAAQWIPRGGEAMLDYLAESRLVGAMPGRYQIPTARIMAAGRDAALGTAEVGEGALNGAEAYTWGARAAPMRYDDRSGAVVDEQGRQWFHDGGTVGAGGLVPVDYEPIFDEDPLAAALPLRPDGLVAGGNLDIYNRPLVNNPDGSISTTRSIGIGTDRGEVLVPGVGDGRQLSSAEARDRYQRTGENFGTFRSADEASAYARWLHEQQAGQVRPMVQGPDGSWSAYQPRTAADAGNAALDASGIPLMRDAWASAQRGEYLPAIGQAGTVAAGYLPALRMGGAIAREGFNAMPALLEDVAGSVRLPGNAMARQIELPLGGNSAEATPRLERINQLAGEGLEERTGGRPPGYPRRSFSEIQAEDKGELAALEPRSRYDVLPEPIRVYHGSGAEFTRPDMGKIGTGEGAQAYTHGLYWAGARGTGETYQRQAAEQAVDRAYDRVDKMITATRQGNPGKHYGTDDVKAMLSLDPELAPLANDDRAVRSISHLLSHGESIAHNQPMTSSAVKAWGDLDTSIGKTFKKPGHLYEGELYLDPAQMFNLDAPLSQQPESIFRMAQERGLTGKPYDRRPAPAIGPGHDLYNDLSRSLHEPGGDNSKAAMDERATDVLRSYGVPGARYLDGVSRNVQLLSPDETTHGQWLVKQIPNGHVHYRGSSEAEARAAYENLSRNYVTYSDQPVLLLKRNGESIYPPANFRLVPVEGEPEF
jgi:hypothetical protein